MLLNDFLHQILPGLDYLYKFKISPNDIIEEESLTPFLYLYTLLVTFIPPVSEITTFSKKNFMLIKIYTD